MGREAKKLQIINQASIKHIVLHSIPHELTTTDCIPDLDRFTHVFFDTVERLIIPNGTERTWTNDRTDLIISNLHSLTTISIGMNCYCNVDSLRIINNPSLTTLQIGANSFTNEDGNSLCISDCCELKDISILHKSFVYFKECAISSMPYLILKKRCS